jgi:hypothetical protein
LRKFALLMSVCVPVLFATLAHAQQFDFAVGGGTLFSTRNTTASQGYVQPAEKGGLYPSVSFDRVYKNHYGYSAELTYRDKQGLYNDYQRFRPVIYDFNALYEPHLTGLFPARQEKRISIDFMGGAGGESVLYANPYGYCGYSTGCSTRLDSNHFLLHASAEIRYRLWRNFFIRPEAHIYHIINNTNDFHSDNVFRLGASLGYTFHTD